MLMDCKVIKKNPKKTGLLAVLAIAMPLIITWEGSENTAYKDIVGVWTICSGETQNVYEGQYMSDAECAKLTEKRVREFAIDIDDIVTVPMSPELHASLTLWSYNVGINAARRSTLVRKLNAGDYKGACEQLKRWNRAGGRVIKGLNNRRIDEYELCIKGIGE